MTQVLAVCLTFANKKRCRNVTDARGAHWGTVYIGKSCLKKMGDLIEPGTHRSTNIKVKIETL